jgi:TRAP-type uncharacterized transport system substrate-binding protein
VTGPEPRLGRPVTLTFRGDWGQANMHRICGWLAQEIGDRSPAGSRFAIWSGRGGADAITAVLRGDADIAIMTPAAAAEMVARGCGPLAVDGAGRLRALGTLPQRDRLVTCVDAALGVSGLSDLAEALPRLRIATSPDDGVNLIGLAAHRLLAAVGITPHSLREAGGSLLYSERPFPALAAFREGTANVLIQEAIMTPGWGRVAELRAVAYLDADPAVIRAFGEWHWPAAVVPAGYLPALDRDLTALEFSDFLVICTDELPDDVAGLAAWCMVATRQALEAQYRHLPPDRSPVSYPLDPEAIASAPIPLHPGAAAAYTALDKTSSAAGELMWA